MWSLFSNPAMLPFSVAVAVLVILLIIELFSFFFGGLTGFLDNLVPDALADADLDADIDTHGDLSLGLKVLDWLYFGRIPTMILLILWIISFAICGFIIQQLSFSFLGYYLSPWLASIDAVVMSVPILKVLAALIYPILPKDETTAVSEASLIGHSAKIVIGYAKIGEPAQAKLIDKHGQTHYIMVEPDPETCKAETFQDSDVKPILSTDDDLIITKKIGQTYLVKNLNNK